MTRQHTVPLFLLGLLLAFLLGGCGSPLVRPGESVQLKSFSLVSPIPWSQFTVGRERIWTLDGPLLNRVWMIDGVKPGEQVFLNPRPTGRRKGEGAIFRAGISDVEAVELIADGLRDSGVDELAIEQVAPFRFGSHPGFRFDFGFASRRGLRYRGIGVGEIAGDSLSFVLFFAPGEFYFERDRAAVERLLGSIRTR
jgi:hypothetical protein